MSDPWNKEPTPEGDDIPSEFVDRDPNLPGDEDESPTVSEAAEEEAPPSPS